MDELSPLQLAPKAAADAACRKGLLQPLLTLILARSNPEWLERCIGVKAAVVVACVADAHDDTDD